MWGDQDASKPNSNTCVLLLGRCLRGRLRPAPCSPDSHVPTLHPGQRCIFSLPDAEVPYHISFELNISYYFDDAERVKPSEGHVTQGVSGSVESWTRRTAPTIGQVRLESHLGHLLVMCLGQATSPLKAQLLPQEKDNITGTPHWMDVKM